MRARPTPGPFSLLLAAVLVVLALGCGRVLGPKRPPAAGIELTFGVDLETALRERAEDHARRLDARYGPGFAIPGTPTADGRPVLVVPAGRAAAHPDHRTTLTSLGYQPEATGDGERWAMDPALAEEIRVAAQEQVVEVIRRRGEAMDVEGLRVTPGPGGTVVVRAAGIADSDLVDRMGVVGVLGFHAVDEGWEASRVAGAVEEARRTLGSDADVRAIESWMRQHRDLPADRIVRFEEVVREDGSAEAGKALVLHRDAMVGGDRVADASVGSDPRGGVYVSLNFDEEGARAFRDGTAAIVGDRLAIVVDGRIVSAPVVREAIAGGRARIDLGASPAADQMREAEALTLALRSGALPSPIHLVSVTQTP